MLTTAQRHALHNVTNPCKQAEESSMGAFEPEYVCVRLGGGEGGINLNNIDASDE
jgi:hypothetical protein